jgi:DHA2 family multidrug resistance protein
MTASEPTTPLRRLVLSLFVMSATLMQVLDTTIANVALPHMQAALNATQEQVAWVLTSYILASAIATPLTGALENRLGRRAVFTIAVGGFTIASAMCGAAPTLTAMVAARALQGLFGALLLPLSQAAMLDIYPVEKRATAITIWSMGSMIGPISGPVLGGIITESFNWRWIFYVNVPFGILCTAGLWLMLEPGKAPARKFDAFGYILLAISFAGLQLMLDRGTQKDWFDSTEIILEAAIATGAFWMFLIHTLTTSRPLIPRALFRDRNFMMGTGLTIFIVAVMYSSQALIAPMLQQLLNYSTKQAGMLMMPRGIGTMMSMLIAGRLLNRIDVRIMMLTGLTILGTAQYVMSGYDVVMDSYPIMLAGFLQGAGMGLVVVPLTMIAYATLPSAVRTDATAVFAIMRNLSASVAIAAMGALFAHNVQMIHAEVGTHVTAMSMPMLDGRLVEQLGHAGGMVAAMVDAEVNRQALMIAYIDNYWLMMWGAAAAMPFVLMLRPRKAAKEEPAPAAAE